MVRNSHADEERTIRAITLNTHQGFGAARRKAVLLRIRQALRASGAHLVFLQEIGVAVGADAAASQYEVLADQVWPQHAYGRNAAVSGGHHGNALLSKFPIVAWRNVDLSVGHAEARGMLHCMLEIPGAEAPLHTICLHLALRESHRRQQADRLLRFVAAEIPANAPLVVAGDFNDWRCTVHQRLVREATLESIHQDARGVPPRTFPDRCPLLRLDRMYARNLRHRPIPLKGDHWAALSDHVAQAAELRWGTPD